MYFRFRPSKAKSIGDVLMNRQNAAKYLLRFLFLINFFCCVIRRFEIETEVCTVRSNPTILYLDEHGNVPLLTHQMTLHIAYSNYERILYFSPVRSALPIDGR
ncbi:MAG: hypothetical protein ACK55Z_28015 [bacterium]